LFVAASPHGRKALQSLGVVAAMMMPMILASMLVGMCIAQYDGDGAATPPESNASEGLASWVSCAAESQQCSWWRPCCGSMKCESLLGGSGRVCVDKQPQCVSENGICGGPGQLTQRCCDDMQCQRLFGGSQMRCQHSRSQCVPENSICGGPGQLTQRCCGNTQCKRLLGGDDMKCMP